MKRITCREIGAKLGLSHVAVSLALRDHPSLPESTKEKVRKMATELGYRPDPVLGALNAYRQASRGLKYQATLAWINAFPGSMPRSILELFEGAKERAERLGFHLEPFSVPTVTDWTRLARTLKSRRIEGLLLPPPLPGWNPDDQCDFPWHDFSAVALGEIAGPSHHLVINNQFQSAARAVRELHALGYRRIGTVMPSVFAGRTEFHFLGGYLSECAHLKLPLLYLLDDTPDNSQFKEDTIQWIERHQPDAIIASGDGDILPALNEAKLRIPDDIAVAFLLLSAQHPEIAGIDQNNRQIGEAAANTIVDLIRRNERGIPTSPLRHLIEATWVGGPSAPPKRNATPSVKKNSGPVTQTTK